MNSKRIPSLPPPRPFFPSDPYQSFVKKDPIIENYSIITWSQRFPFHEIPTNDLTSLFLNDSPLFIELKTLIESFNSEVRFLASSKEQLRNGPWRSTFFAKLHNMLLEVIFTKNRKLQVFFMETVHSWAIDQLERFDTQGGQKGGTRPVSAVSTAVGTITRPNTGIGRVVNLPVKPLSSSLRPSTAIQKVQQQDSLPPQTARPFSAAVGGWRPISGFKREEEGRDKKPEEEEDGVIYEWIRPLSGWTRPVSSITRPQSSIPRPEIQEEESILEERPHSTSLIPEEEKAITMFKANRAMPSDYIHSTLKEYSLGARTNITTVDPPYERIKNYNRKILQQGIKEEEEQPRSAQKPLSPTSKIKYSKNLMFQDQQQAFRDQKAEEARKKEEEAKKIAEGEVKKEEEGKKEENEVKKKRKVKKKKVYAYVDMAPQHKPFVNDDLGAGVKKEKEEEHLRKNFEIKSTFLHYQPSDDPREMNMELRWLYNRHKEVFERRMDEEIQTLIREWASAKERIEVEISRKIQSEYLASRFDQVNHAPPWNQQRPQTAHVKLKSGVTQMMVGQPYYKLEGLEGRMDVQKISAVRTEYKGMLGGHGEEGGRGDKVPKSLSIFTHPMARPRPFSAILNQHTSYESKLSSKNEAISEIQQIKEKMAKFNLFIDGKTLERGLLIPEGTGKEEGWKKDVQKIEEGKVKKEGEGGAKKEEGGRNNQKRGASAIVRRGKVGSSSLGKKEKGVGSPAGRREGMEEGGRRMIEGGGRREVYWVEGMDLLKNPFVVEKKKKKRRMKKKKK